MRYAGVAGTPSAFEILGQHRYVRAQAAQAASKNQFTSLDISIPHDCGQPVEILSRGLARV